MRWTPIKLRWLYILNYCWPRCNEPMWVHFWYLVYLAPCRLLEISTDDFTGFQLHIAAAAAFKRTGQNAERYFATYVVMRWGCPGASCINCMALHFTVRWFFQYIPNAMWITLEFEEIQKTRMHTKKSSDISTNRIRLNRLWTTWKVWMDNAFPIRSKCSCINFIPWR